MYEIPHTQNGFYYKAAGMNSSNKLIILLLCNCPNVNRNNFCRRSLKFFLKVSAFTSNRNLTFLLQYRMVGRYEISLCFPGGPKRVYPRRSVPLTQNENQMCKLNSAHSKSMANWYLSPFKILITYRF
jgi:hypothetical protein